MFKKIIRNPSVYIGKCIRTYASICLVALVGTYVCVYIHINTYTSLGPYLMYTPIHEIESNFAYNTRQIHITVWRHELEWSRRYELLLNRQSLPVNTC